MSMCTRAHWTFNIACFIFLLSYTLLCDVHIDGFLFRSWPFNYMHTHTHTYKPHFIQFLLDELYAVLMPFRSFAAIIIFVFESFVVIINNNKITKTLKICNWLWSRQIKSTTCLHAILSKKWACVHVWGSIIYSGKDDEEEEETKKHAHRTQNGIEQKKKK